jgi:hypothetical protein
MFGQLVGGEDVATAPQSHMTITLALLTMLGVVLLTGVVLACAVVRYLRSCKAAALAGRTASVRTEFSRGRAPVFDPPGRWLAIKSGNQQMVQAALGLHNATPCSWTEGMARASDQKLFISPPVNGWILVMGTHLPDPFEDVDALFCFLLRLSRALGEIQFFSVNRVLGHHAWARLDHGRVVRGYAWCGETLWNQGSRTWAERRLGLKCHDYLAGDSRDHFGPGEQTRANAEKVVLLASIWSIDPASVDESLLTGAVGVAGDFSQTRLH